jgi:hypothetical protein
VILNLCRMTAVNALEAEAQRIAVKAGVITGQIHARAAAAGLYSSYGSRWLRGWSLPTTTTPRPLLQAPSTEAREDVASNLVVQNMPACRCALRTAGRAV